MQIVIDANILFSAIIKNSETRRLILEYEGIFLFPSYIFDELEVHKSELIRKSKLNQKEFDDLLRLLLRKVLIVTKEVLNSKYEEAIKIINNIDPDDVLFIACALVYPESLIWSNDRNLKKQNAVKVVNTSELMRILL